MDSDKETRELSRKSLDDETKEVSATDATDVVVDRGFVPSVEAVPPKSLVFIWILMAAELGFDLVTTIIAFAATIGDQYCCGNTIFLGPLPLTTTIPFFLLILAELSFLGRAILLTLWPSGFGDPEWANSAEEKEGAGFEVELAEARTGTEDPDSSEERDMPVTTCGKANEGSEKEDEEIELSARDGVAVSMGQCKEYEPQYIGAANSKNDAKFSLRRLLCGCMKWKARVVLNVLNLLTLLNPFFGCLIAWMLLYKSDKNEAFVVLGLEGFSIILHFISVRLEGGLRTWCSRLIHSITVLPFLVSVILMLVYLREGGVCYVVESQLFLFSGCELCPDTFEPPDANGMCGNATLSGAGGVVEDFENFDITNIGALAERGAYQGSYCSEKVNFCFYPF
mmetsp:Transcript_15146/g.24508  ORF Transcript_15146/g.24508 Transcript_15146/m.24508 type:complete len:396 (-) Transcript_15146:72-1259(-)